jgi:hypothetical protein
MNCKGRRGDDPYQQENQHAEKFSCSHFGECAYRGLRRTERAVRARIME